MPLDPSKPPQEFLGQILDAVVGDKKEADAITPDYNSPVDLAAGVLGAGIGNAMAHGASEILGNEIGAIGVNIARPKAPVYYTHLAGEQTVAPGIIQKIEQRLGLPAGTPIEVLMQQPNLTQKEMNTLVQKASRSQPVQKLADGGEVAQSMEATSVNVIDPSSGEIGSIPEADLKDAIAQGYTPATPEQLETHFKTQKYGTLGEQTKTALEGAASGATFGLSTGLETSLGLADAEDIRSRREVNPNVHALGQVAGLAASTLLPGMGEAGLLAKAGKGAASAVGLGGRGAGYLSQVGADAVKGAFETALFQGGDEISKAFSQDPSSTAEHAVAEIGLAGVLGGVFGGALGATMRGLTKLNPSFVSELDMPKVESGDLKGTIENSDLIPELKRKGLLEGLTAEKPEAKEIRAAAERLGNAPVLEGMTSSSKLIHDLESSLLNGPPTVSGMARRDAYKEGQKLAESAINEALGDGVSFSKAELGDNLKKSMISKINQESTPINELYDLVKSGTSHIPLSEDAAPAIMNSIKGIQELRLSPSSPEGAIAKRVMNEIKNLKTVDDVKTYKTILNRSISPTASSGEKHMVGVLSDKLSDLERNSVERFALKSADSPEAKNKVLDLIQQRKVADAAYKPFKQDLSTLLEQLGKGRVHGAQDAIHFISHLTPEEITTKLFSKKDSEFLKFFEKKFPEEMDLLRSYQKGVLKEKASSSPRWTASLLRDLNKLEPEIQKSLFKPEELSKIKDAEIYLKSFPANANPSGTAHMEDIKEFFKGPGHIALANVRDAGVEKFIQAVANNESVNQAMSLGKSTVKGWNTASRALKAIFNPDTLQMPAAIVPSEATRNKLDKLVAEYSKDPTQMLGMGDSNPVPEYSAAFAQTGLKAIQYLNAIKPKQSQGGPLDTKREPSAAEKYQYNKALDIAQKPLSILKNIKDGSLTLQDVTTLRTIYPSLYNTLSQRLTDEIIEASRKEILIPYKTRMSMSLFLGQPLDSTMTPSGIMASQMVSQSGQKSAAQLPMQEGVQPKGVKSSPALQKMPGMFQTPEQARQQRQNKQ